MLTMKHSAIAVLTALGIGAGAAMIGSSAEAQGWGPGYGPGQGMMGGSGYGRGPRGAEDDGYRFGPGMMGGPGMRGMMGGRGMGMGMGMGPGAGMMGGPALAALDLTDAQRKQVLTIQDDVRKKNWTTMGAMHDEMQKLRDALWTGEQRDRPAIVAANKRMSELRQQMLDNALDAADRIEKVLTPQQRDALKKRWGPGWMIDPEE